VSAAGLARALSGPLAAGALGQRVLAEFADASTGTVLLNRSATEPAAPASTAKLATAAALLTVYRPTDRITTRVVAGASPGTVVLVGAGDPTLTAAAPGQAGAYPDAARISDLAAELKTARAGKPVTAVVVDTSLFSGPAVSPDWAPGDAPSEYAAPITAALVDGARDTPAATTRSADPAGAAGHALAAALGVPTAPVSIGRAPTSAATLASVRSAPISELIDQMLGPSDNVLADVLGRLVAVKAHQPASFTGCAAAIRTTLTRLGVAIGTGMRDCSGLAADDRLTPASLVALLRVITSTKYPALHDIVTGLPVAGWSGTLAGRYLGSPSAGRIRAKTGTLTSVSSLAGFVQDRNGRLLVFAMIADRVGPSAADTSAAETALDNVAAATAACGCP
jgi:D-alanyl-D-alanine carboxypeptidase/D-alanyl-D-alanine-endopeptidase (penicillin-binding protein 4)